MPEGDTIWRTARALDTALAGRRVKRLETSRPNLLARSPSLTGRLVLGAEAIGKHLLLSFEGGLALHTHLGMRGAWYVRHAAGAARRPEAGSALRLDAEDVIAICARPLLAELLTDAELRRNQALRRLGPDAAREGFDRREALARLRAQADREIGVALVDQSVLAGVGNVYKSELLFRAGLDPRARVGDLDDGALDALLADASRLLRANLERGVRRTSSRLSGSALAVYGRPGRACPRCGTTLRRLRQGAARRFTDYCPSCQR
ncbi:MAG: Fpg/Nei family DNA glycosylase [Vicinamibacteria bacterium]